MTTIFLIAICGTQTIAYRFVVDHLEALNKETAIIKAFDKWAKKDQGECVGIELSYTNQGYKMRGIPFISKATGFIFGK